MANGRCGFFLLLLLLLLMAGTPVAKAFDLQIKGLKADLQKNVTDHLSSIIHDDKDNQVVVDSRLKARLEQSVRDALRAKGYYEPKIELLFSDRQISGKLLLTVQIIPGKPLTIAGVNVTINGPATQDIDYQKLLKEALPVVGEVLDHGKFDNFVTRLSTLAAHNGYFDAAIASSELQVSPMRYQAFWKITFNSGNRYYFGPVTIQGSLIKPAISQNVIPFKVGDPYTISAVMALNRRLSATQWFRAVIVTPQFDKVNGGHHLPLLVTVTPHKRNIIETGLRYATDIGPGIRINWRKPWINTLGHSLDSHLNVSKPQQQLDFSYRIPLQKSPLEQYYLISAGCLKEHQNDTVSKTLTAAFARYWDLLSGWQPAINLHWRHDCFTQGNQTLLTTQLLYPGVSFSRVRQRGGLMPEWGDSQRYSVDFSSRFWGSAVNFSYFKMRNVWIRTPWQHHRWLIRFNVGWIKTDNFPMVPASLRLFAGGEDSIRGYGYHVLAPKDVQGKLIGASRLATGSLEYHYGLSQGWWLALFADSGAAVDKFVRSDLRTGVGVGLRWASPLGPIKLNVAKPIGDAQHRKLHFYLSFGSEL